MGNLEDVIPQPHICARSFALWQFYMWLNIDSSDDNNPVVIGQLLFFHVAFYIQTMVYYLTPTCPLVMHFFCLHSVLFLVLYLIVF